MEDLRRQVAACSRMLVDAGILAYSGHTALELTQIIF